MSGDRLTIHQAQRIIAIADGETTVGSARQLGYLAWRGVWATILSLRSRGLLTHEGSTLTLTEAGRARAERERGRLLRTPKQRREIEHWRRLVAEAHVMLAHKRARTRAHFESALPHLEARLAALETGREIAT